MHLTSRLIHVNHQQKEELRRGNFNHIQIFDIYEESTSVYMSNNPEVKIIPKKQG